MVNTDTSMPDEYFVCHGGLHLTCTHGSSPAEIERATRQRVYYQSRNLDIFRRASDNHSRYFPLFSSNFHPLFDGVQEENSHQSNDQAHQDHRRRLGIIENACNEHSQKLALAEQAFNSHSQTLASAEQAYNNHSQQMAAAERAYEELVRKFDIVEEAFDRHTRQLDNLAQQNWRFENAVQRQVNGQTNERRPNNHGRAISDVHYEVQERAVQTEHSPLALNIHVDGLHGGQTGLHRRLGELERQGRNAAAVCEDQSCRLDRLQAMWLDLVHRVEALELQDRGGDAHGGEAPPPYSG